MRAQRLDQFISPFVGGLADEPAVTVLSRLRPDYQSPGVRLGSVMVRPSLVESGGYESNVLGSARARGSALVETTARVEANSDVSRLDVNGAIDVDDVRYLDLGRQSYTNWSARLNGSYEVGRDLASVRFEHLDLTQTARDLDVPQVLERPLAWRTDSLQASYRANFNRLSVTPSLQVARYAYDSGIAGGAVYPQDYRNRVLVTPVLSFGYEFAPRRSLVVVVRNTSAYYARGTGVLPRRNYNDTTLLAGLDYDLTGRLRLRALLGYETRFFQASAYRSIQAPVAELSLIWTPTGLTSVTASVARQIQDASADTTAGVTQTSARLRLDHEYRRNVLLSANAGMADNAYRGGDQVLYTAGAGVTYLANRTLGVSGTYDFLVRQKSGNTQLNAAGLPIGSDYTDHRILLQLRFAL